MPTRAERVTSAASSAARSSNGRRSSARPSCSPVTPRARQRRPGPGRAGARRRGPGARACGRALPAARARERARPRAPILRADEVQAPVDAVGAVDVRVPGRGRTSPGCGRSGPGGRGWPGRRRHRPRPRTMRPPTPSTSSVQPTSSGATSCTLRAKKSRESTIRRAARTRRAWRSPRAALGAPAEVGEVDAALVGVLGDALGEGQRVVQELRAGGGVLPHLEENRPLGAAGDDGLCDPVHPDERSLASAPVLAADRLERVDLVRARILAEAEEDHAGRAVRHAGIIASRPATDVRETIDGVHARETGDPPPRPDGSSLP